MAFRYQPLIGGELFDVAARFSEEAEGKIAGARDSASHQQAIAQCWSEAEALGWPLSLIPEAAGGVGGSLEDTLALIEGAARSALPAPLIKSLLLAPRLLDNAALARVAAGEVRPAVMLDGAYPWRGAWQQAGAVRLASGRVNGEIQGSEWVPDATHYLIAVEDQLALIPADRTEAQIHRRIDGRLAVDLRLNGVVPEAIYAGGTVDEALDLAALATCVEIVAGAATVIEDTVLYLNERKQFGVALSSFQVLRHYVADMYVAFQNAHAVTATALRGALESPDQLPWRDIALAKLRVGEVARFIAETSIQCHGGMGMTEENRATRIGKRLVMADLEWGDRSRQSERLLDHRELAA